MHWQNWGWTLELEHQQYCRFSSGLDLSLSFKSLISTTQVLFGITAGQKFFKFPTSPMQTVSGNFSTTFNLVRMYTYMKLVVVLLILLLSSKTHSQPTYACFENDKNTKLRLWVSFDKNEKAKYIKYEGQKDSIQLIHSHLEQSDNPGGIP